MAYEWTDWIDHVPGQRLLPGAYAEFEFVGSNPARSGTEPHVPYTVEGAVTHAMMAHPCWQMADTRGSHCMITRYRLRIEAERKAINHERELEIA
ncbi:MAG: hypothetical protein AAFV54_17070 [Pseudomonadota bacterium]